MKELLFAVYDEPAIFFFLHQGRHTGNEPGGIGETFPAERFCEQFTFCFVQLVRFGVDEFDPVPDTEIIF